MAFTYDDSLTDAASRVRLGVGDIVSPGLLPDATYAAVLTAQGDDETKAIRQVAAALAARYAIEPSSLSSKGSTLTWGERVAQWRLIAQGAAGGAASGRAKGFTLLRGPARDYTTGDGDASD